MLNKSGLDLRCGESVSGDIHNIIHTTSNPVVAFMISASAVASELQDVSRAAKTKTELNYVIALVHVEIGIHVTFMSTPYGSSHARPWLLNSQNTLYIVAMYFFPGDWVNDRGLDAKER